MTKSGSIVGAALAAAARSGVYASEVYEISVTSALGYGRQKGYTETCRGWEGGEGVG